MSLPIQIVDENDQPIDSATIQEAHDKDLIHRIVRVMIADGEGNVLLQKRAPDRQLHPDTWDNSAAGHVDAGESYEFAAARELVKTHPDEVSDGLQEVFERDYL